MEMIFKTEDEEEARRILKSLDLALALHDIDNYLRSQIKYEDKDLHEVRDKFHEFLYCRGIVLEELVS